MHSLTISFGPTAQMWRLLFKDSDPSAHFQGLLHSAPPNGLLEITDDFGQRAAFKINDIHAWMVEDMQKSQLAYIEFSLHNARMQAKGQEMAESDQVLRATRARQGPGIISPMMGGNGRFPG